MNINLDQQEHGFLNLVENLNDSILRFDTNLKCIYCNKSVGNIPGIGKEKVIGNRIEEIVPDSENKKIMLTAFNEVLHDGKIREIEQVFPALFEKKYFISRIIPEKDINNRVISLFLISRDITEQKKAEFSLKGSEEIFRLLISNSHDIIYTISIEGIFTFVSPAWTSLLGHPVSNVIGKHIQDFIHPDDRQSSSMLVKKVIETGSKIDSLEYRIKHLDGTWYWHATNAIPIRDGSGKTTGIEGIARDITERKKAEESLKQSERNYREIFDSSSDAMALQDIETGLMLNVNNTMLEMYGYKEKEEILKCTIEDLSALEEGYSLKKIIVMNQRAIDSGSNSFEWRAKRKNGDVFWVQVRMRKTTIGGKDRILTSVHDITERKSAEEKLEQSEMMFRSISENAFDLISLIDLNGIYIYCNPSYFSILGYLPDELSGKNAFDLVVEEDREIAIRVFQESLKEPDSRIQKTLRLYCRNKEIRYIDHRGSFIFNSDRKPEKILLLANDITQQKKNEEALKASESKYNELYTLLRLMSDTMPDMLWAKDLENRYIFTNRAICEFLLHAKDTFEPVGKTDLYFAMRERAKHPENPKWHTFGELCVNSDEITLKEMREMQFDEFGNVCGKLLYLDVHKAPLFNKEGKLIGVVGSARDITGRKQVEMALRESENKFSKIFKVSPYPIMIIDLENGNFNDVNEAMIHNLGFSREELIGRNAAEIGIIKPGSEILLKEILLRKGNFSDMEVTITTKSGEERTGLAAGEIIEINKHKYLIQTVADFTERKQAEEALRRREILLDAAAGIGQLLLNESNIQVALNEAIRLIGIASGQDRSYIFKQEHKEDPEISMSLCYEWVREGITPQLDNPELQKIPFSIAAPYSYGLLSKGLNVHGMVKDLPQFEKEILESQDIISILLVPIKNDNGLWGFIGFDNCTAKYEWSIGEQAALATVAAAIGSALERKKAEENLKESNRKLEEALSKLKETQRQALHQERMRSLGQLASGIAHDINNSLTPILGYVDLLTDDRELMERNEKPINMIIKSTKNIARTIGRLKEFYKVKLTDDDLAELNINKIIYSTLELTRHKWKNIAESTGAVIDIKLELEEKLPLTRVDESELIEALTNIILNACDAMPMGGILTFKTLRQKDDIVIEITDTGFGMDDEVVKHCIDPFFTTKGEKGSGLGLAMVYGIIKRHKGEIKINSKPNKGSTISIILPITKEYTEEKLVDPELSFLKPLKILGVEDDALISDMLKNILEKRGHTITQASDGHSGLELFQKSIAEKEPFDLVISDLGMPGLDGATLSTQIKKISPEIPVILLTGWGNFLDKDNYPSVDYILKKPILREDLFKAINELVKENKIKLNNIV